MVDIEVDDPILGKATLFDPYHATEFCPWAGWKIVEKRSDGLACRRADGVLAIASGILLEGRHWIHVSVSRRSRLPSWMDLKAVKNMFIGPDRRAIQILPAQKEYVNFCKYCLHLWACVEEDGLPDFTMGKGII